MVSDNYPLCEKELDLSEEASIEVDGNHNTSPSSSSSSSPSSLLFFAPPSRYSAPSRSSEEHEQHHQQLQLRESSSTLLSSSPFPYTPTLEELANEHRYFNEEEINSSIISELDDHHHPHNTIRQQDSPLSDVAIRPTTSYSLEATFEQLDFGPALVDCQYHQQTAGIEPPKNGHSSDHNSTISDISGGHQVVCSSERNCKQVNDRSIDTFMLSSSTNGQNSYHTYLEYDKHKDKQASCSSETNDAKIKDNDNISSNDSNSDDNFENDTEEEYKPESEYLSDPDEHDHRPGKRSLKNIRRQRLHLGKYQTSFTDFQQDSGGQEGSTVATGKSLELQVAKFQPGSGPDQQHRQTHNSQDLEDLTDQGQEEIESDDQQVSEAYQFSNQDDLQSCQLPSQSSASCNYSNYQGRESVGKHDNQSSENSESGENSLELRYDGEEAPDEQSNEEDDDDSEEKESSTSVEVDREFLEADNNLDSSREIQIVLDDTGEEETKGQQVDHSQVQVVENTTGSSSTWNTLRDNTQDNNIRQEINMRGLNKDGGDYVNRQLSRQDNGHGDANGNIVNVYHYDKTTHPIGYYCNNLAQSIMTNAIQEIINNSDKDSFSQNAGSVYSSPKSPCDHDTNETNNENNLDDLIDPPEGYSSNETSVPLDEVGCSNGKKEGPLLSYKEAHQQQVVIKNKRKVYASSMYYSDESESFPTLEQQVERCREICNQLKAALPNEVHEDDDYSMSGKQQMICDGARGHLSMLCPSSSSSSSSSQVDMNGRMGGALAPDRWLTRTNINQLDDSSESIDPRQSTSNYCINRRPANKASEMFRRRYERMNKFTLTSRGTSDSNHNSNNECQRRFSDTDCYLLGVRQGNSCYFSSDANSGSCQEGSHDDVAKRRKASIDKDKDDMIAMTDTEYEAPKLRMRRFTPRRIPLLTSRATIVECTSTGLAAKLTSDIVDVVENNNEQTSEKLNELVGNVQQVSDAQSVPIDQSNCLPKPNCPSLKPFLHSMNTWKDLETLRKRSPHIEYNEHNVVSPDDCKKLVNDLRTAQSLHEATILVGKDTNKVDTLMNSPPKVNGVGNFGGQGQQVKTMVSKGAKIFEERQLKSASWIVDSSPTSTSTTNMISCKSVPDSPMNMGVNEGEKKRPVSSVEETCQKLVGKLQFIRPKTIKNCLDLKKQQLEKHSTNISNSNSNKDKDNNKTQVERATEYQFVNGDMSLSNSCQPLEDHLEFLPMVVCHYRPQIQMATVTDRRRCASTNLVSKSQLSSTSRDSARLAVKPVHHLGNITMAYYDYQMAPHPNQSLPPAPRSSIFNIINNSSSSNSSNNINIRDERIDNKYNMEHCGPCCSLFVPSRGNCGPSVVIGGGGGVKSAIELINKSTGDRIDNGPMGEKTKEPCRWSASTIVSPQRCVSTRYQAELVSLTDDDNEEQSITHGKAKHYYYNRSEHLGHHPPFSKHQEPTGVPIKSYCTAEPNTSTGRWKGGSIGVGSSDGRGWSEGSVEERARAECEWANRWPINRLTRTRPATVHYDPRLYLAKEPQGWPTSVAPSADNGHHFHSHHQYEPCRGIVERHHFREQLTSEHGAGGVPPRTSFTYPSTSTLKWSLAPSASPSPTSGPSGCSGAHVAISAYPQQAHQWRRTPDNQAWREINMLQPAYTSNLK